MMSHEFSTKVISFSSGKGGVGKTSLVSNLGSLWAQQGKKTLLIDGDWHLGKLGIAMGVRPQWTVEKVLSGTITLKDAITPISDSLSLLASPSGILGFEELDETSRHQLFYAIEDLHNEFDLILIDHSSGLHQGVTTFAAAAHQHVVVTTSEPTSYTDAYAVMKILSQRYSIREFGLVVTMSHDHAESQRIMERFIEITTAQLNVKIKLLEIFPWEPKLSLSIIKQRPFIDLYPRDPFTRKLSLICKKLDENPAARNHGLQFFYAPALGR